jgi:hypothetical protein
MYQPKIKDELIRKLYFLAQREKKKMTHVVNEILEEYLVAEPDPPPYEPRWMRYQPHPAYAKRKERAIHKLMREYHGETHDCIPCSGGVPERVRNGHGDSGTEDRSPHESLPAESDDAGDPPFVCGSDLQGSERDCPV